VMSMLRFVLVCVCVSATQCFVQCTSAAVCDMMLMLDLGRVSVQSPQ